MRDLDRGNGEFEIQKNMNFPETGSYEEQIRFLKIQTINYYDTLLSRLKNQELSLTSYGRDNKDNRIRSVNEEVRTEIRMAFTTLINMLNKFKKTSLKNSKEDSSENKELNVLITNIYTLLENLELVSSDFHKKKGFLKNLFKKSEKNISPGLIQKEIIDVITQYKAFLNLFQNKLAA